MKLLLVLLAVTTMPLTSCAFLANYKTQNDTITILSLNIFDQQQGNWPENFRTSRLKALASQLNKFNKSPDIVFLQESQAEKKRGKYLSKDAQHLNFPNHHYTHESFEKDGMSYGYLILSKKKPNKVWKDSFHFAGGSKRVVQFSLWHFKGWGCLGVANIHLSWQSSEVRYKEAQFLVEKMPALKASCSNWLLAGDFNADENSNEMKFLFDNGFNNFLIKAEPTVGPFNPIRSIYGKIKNQTIDWILGTDTIQGRSHVMFDEPVDEVWISDHSAVFVTLSKIDK